MPEHLHGLEANDIFDKHNADGDHLDDASKPIAILWCVNGQGELINEFPILSGDDMIVGRKHENSEQTVNVSIPDDSNYPIVSKQHFRIYSIIFDRKDHNVQPLIYCEDLGSTNGTYVNDACIGMIGRERIGHLLSDGDLIEVRPNWRFRLHQPPRIMMTAVQGQMEDIECFRDHYTISDRILGSGQYGAVFLANEVITSKQMACKIIDLELAMDQRGVLSESQFNYRRANAMPGKEIIMREIKILSALNHPHIVNLKKAFYSDNNIYTFTDLAPGGDLFSYIDYHGGLLTDCHSRITARQIVLALDYMHSKGIAHRDIKPENVLVMHTDFGGRVVLTDFGFATYVDPKSGRMKSKVGTDGYLAPEVNNVELSTEGYTTAADLWSLGVLTVFLLTGDTVLPRDDLSQFSQVQIAERFLGMDSNTREQWHNLSPRALRFLRALLVLNPMDRLTASQALNHSWFKKPHSEAVAIQECCARIIRFWKKRDIANEVIEHLTHTRKGLQAEDWNELSRQRKIPDASSSPYFSLEQHLQAKVPSQRRTLLERLTKTGSWFINTAQGSNLNQHEIASTHGRDIFGKVPTIQTMDQVESDDGISLVPTSPQPQSEKDSDFNLGGPANPCVSQDDRSAADSGRVERSSGKRVRWESEESEERNIRDDVAKEGPRWQSAKALNVAVKKRKREVMRQSGKAPRLETLAFRSSMPTS